MSINQPSKKRRLDMLKSILIDFVNRKEENYAQ